MEKNRWEQLQEVIENSQSRYYHYPVAALLETSDGSFYQGVNVETSSPQAGICAERCALFASLANGAKDFTRISILNTTEHIITPCFVCRQALHDYCDSNLEIVSYNKLGESKTFLLSDLCPAAFEEDCLK